jgi:hypothetical protein
MAYATAWRGLRQCFIAIANYFSEHARVQYAQAKQKGISR